MELDLDLSGSSPEQSEMIACDAQWQIWVCGRRFGKSRGLAHRSVIRGVEQPGSHTLYVAPSYSRAKEQYESLIEIPGFTAEGFLQKWRSGSPYPQYTLFNGSKISFRSFERPNLLRGMGVDELQVDEAQDINGDLFFRVLVPTTASTRGTVIVSGTFRGKNWCYDLFQKGITPNPTYKSFLYPTSMGPMFQDEAGKAQLKILHDGCPIEALWQEEYECVPTANSFSPFNALESCIAEVAPPTAPRPGFQYYLGLDLGRVKDQSAAVILEAQTGLVVHAEKFPRGEPHSAQAIRAAKLAAHWWALPIVDTTGGSGSGSMDEVVRFYYQTLNDLRPLVWSAANKEQIISRLALDFENKKVTIPACHMGLVSELRIYECRTRGGHRVYAAPDGQHDDYVAALASATWARAKGWAGGAGGSSLRLVNF